ncbi:hypothetical protein BDR26DRAFT_918179 [Obelidium mucronatum]|nr:hypothetical protein BDR26DRAFT_918179 [Obelidium mucronatum]
MLFTLATASSVIGMASAQTLMAPTVANPVVPTVAAPTQPPAVNGIAVTNAAVPAESTVDFLGFVKSLTPCATTCLAKIPSILGSINFESSSGLSSEAAQICAQNKDFIAQCAVTCQSDLLTQLTASCASVGALSGGGVSSPLPTVRTVPAASAGTSNRCALFIGVVSAVFVVL